LADYEHRALDPDCSGGGLVRGLEISFQVAIGFDHAAEQRFPVGERYPDFSTTD
jgi:hypothetical protein